MSNKVRRQHYVWRKYLEPWTADGKIWCRRNTKVFATDLMNVAQERDFYVPERLNDVEKRLLRTDAVGTGRRDIIDFVEDEIQMRDEMFAALDSARSRGDAAEVATLETMVHNYEEGYQGQIESACLDNLSELVAGRIEWARDDDRWQQFILYFATQYLRTKRIQEKIKTALAEHSARLGYSVENLQSVQRHVDAVRLCDGIYRTASLTLLEAQAGTEFITCDQPAFNASAALTREEARTLPHEFYYPVCPTYAVVIMEGAKHAPVTRVAETAEVERYNQVMHMAALEQVFGRSQTAVEPK